MISIAYIKTLCYFNTFNNGLDVYNHSMVKNFSISGENEKTLITASVRNREDMEYEVRINYDSVHDRVTDNFCNCLAFESFSGICKHCVATLLHFFYSSRNKAISDNPFLAANRYRPEVKNTTNLRMQDLLRRCSEKRAGVGMNDDTFGRVKLVPYMSINGSQIQVEFKLGVEKLYVLKNVNQFGIMLHNNEKFSYGKSLSFLHTKEAFAPEYRRMVEFAYNYALKKNPQGRYNYYQREERKISLYSIEISAFFDALGTNELWVSLDGLNYESFTLTEETLPRQISVKGGEDGLWLELKSVFGIKGNDEYIYMDRGKIYRIPMDCMEEVRDFMNCIAMIPEHRAFIAKADYRSFCTGLWPSLQRHFEMKVENFEPDEYMPPQATYEIYLDSPQKKMLSCKLMALYGDEKYNVYSSENRERRDPESENAVKSVIGRYFEAYDSRALLLITADNDNIYELLDHGIENMKKIGEVYVSDAIKKLKIEAAPKVSVGVSVNGNLLDFQIDSGYMSMSELAQILSGYDRKKKYYRLKNGDFVNMDSDSLNELMVLTKNLHLSSADLRDNHVRLPKYRALYMDAELDELENLRPVRDYGFNRLVDDIKTVEDNDFSIPDALKTVLRDYQKTGFNWIKALCANGFGGILADEMGLGKTIQVISFILSATLEGDTGGLNSLIVCPASLVYNWKNEFERFAPGLKTLVISGNASERKILLSEGNSDTVYITSYDLLKRDLEEYDDLDFFCQVIDEAQYIKNHNTQVARSVKLIKSGFRLALTGTPIENRLSELWSIFDYIMPGYLYGYKSFRTEYELPIVAQEDENVALKLRKMISPFILRRLKKDVLKDLPDKLEENMVVRMEGEQKKLYDARLMRLKLSLDKKTEEEFKQSKIEILAELTGLRQLCCDPALVYEDYKGGSAKLDMCIDMVKNAVDEGHKVLIFSQFTSMLEIIEGRLKEEEVKYYELTGATPKEKRQSLVSSFDVDEVPVFCISLKAGGTGLNLTAADIVIHYDPWWNVAAQNQATDRTHRIGQTNVVTVYRLVVKDTIEERILELQEKKKDLSDRIIGGEGSDFNGSFTREELRDVLG